jgi:hypothetical protein
LSSPSTQLTVGPLPDERIRDYYKYKQALDKPRLFDQNVQSVEGAKIEGSSNCNTSEGNCYLSGCRRLSLQQEVCNCVPYCVRCRLNIFSLRASRVSPHRSAECGIKEDIPRYPEGGPQFLPINKKELKGGLLRYTNMIETGSVARADAMGRGCVEKAKAKAKAKVAVGWLVGLKGRRGRVRGRFAKNGRSGERRG